MAWGKSHFCQERFSYNINVKSLRTKLYLNLLKCDPIWCRKLQTKLRNVPTLYKEHSRLISEQGLTDTEKEIVHTKGF